MNAFLMMLAALSMFVGGCSFASTMDFYRWKSRPVIVFGADGDPVFKAQVALLQKAGAGLRERDMILIPVSGRQHEDLRRRYHVAGGAFAILLIGKDGGVKLRSTGSVSPAELFQLVDAMPMRKEEMRRRHSD